MHKTKKLEYIDSLRGLAIIGVILCHIGLFDKISLPIKLESIVGHGAMGVQLFYLASAFTLFLSFAQRSQHENSPIRNFFIRRFFRIAPMYYIGMAYYLWQDGTGSRFWLGDASSVSALNILSNITFTHGLNPYWINSVVPGGWSIGIEMMFYTILPYLFFKINNLNKAIWFFVLSLLFNFLLRILLSRVPLISSQILWDAYLGFYFPNQLPVFALGIIMYFVIIKGDDLLQTSLLPILLLSMMYLFQLAITTNIFFPNTILFGIGFMFFGIALSKYRSFIFINPIINYLGKISYSMYIVQFGVLFWIAKLNLIEMITDKGILNYCTRFLIVLITTISISSLFYKFIELPFQKIGKKIIARSELMFNQNSTN